jgi:hypothetical protein
MERGIGGMRMQRREESGAAGAEDQEIGAQAAHHVGRQPRMSAPGRPKREYRSAQREGSPVSSCVGTLRIIA